MNQFKDYDLERLCYLFTNCIIYEYIDKGFFHPDQNIIEMIERFKELEAE